FTAMKIIAAYDGDVNLKKQQEAYLASKTGEESKVYQYYLKRRVSVDIMILRDVSGSTYRFEREYAEAIVEILAAVNNFEGIRTLVIDFESGAVLRKSFDMKVEQTSIVPLSGGGTNMLPAVQLLEEQKLKGRRRLLFVLSDGEINDREAAERELTAYCSRNQIEQIKLTFDEGDKYGYEHTTIINLHKFIAQKIVEKGIDY
ncbi:vWA domain-containing protein, partial [Phascolarctobacterium faecium]|uniref:vWA domain-containing protein n=1 Tax=Phascolarctobacterium faecium TaxID=33025 RepID=UPI003FEEF78D